MRCLVFNGWAAGPETWSLCTFQHDYVFDYLEQLDGVPERVMEEMDAAVLVGFSMGGSTALRLLLKYPEKVKGLVLISATPRMMEERGGAEVKGQRSEGEGQRSEVKGQRSEVGGERGEIVWKGMSLRRRAALKMGTQLVFRNDPSPLYEERNLDRGLDYLQNTDLRADLLSLAHLFPLPRSPFPVHIFQSERDGIVRPNNAEFMKKVFPQAKVTLVPGSEHVLPVAVPQSIDAAVAEMQDATL